MDYLESTGPPSRWVGLDLGHARCGVALSDPSGTLASPLGVVHTQPVSSLPARIAALFPAEGVLGLIAGLPLTQRSEEGASALAIRTMAERIATELVLQVEFQDERYSTAEVIRRRRESGRSPRQLRAEIDAYAAAAILQSWLDGRFRP